MDEGFVCKKFLVQFKDIVIIRDLNKFDKDFSLQKTRTGQRCKDYMVSSPRLCQLST